MHSIDNKAKIIKILLIDNGYTVRGVGTLRRTTLKMRVPPRVPPRVLHASHENRDTYIMH